MSSYLNFYLTPKKQEEGAKPLLFVSYCRPSNVYQNFTDNLIIPYAGNEDKYLEVKTKDVKRIYESAKDDLAKVKTNLEQRVEAFQKLTNLTSDIVNDYIQDYGETKDYIKELEDAVTELDCIYHWVAEIEYGDFEKVLINIT